MPHWDWIGKNNSNVANTVHRRRKLLEFEHPIDKPFISHELPRYYSSFYPWFQICFDAPACQKPRCIPEYKRVRVLPPKVVTQTIYHPRKQYPLYILLLSIVFMLFYTFS